MKFVLFSLVLVTSVTACKDRVDSGASTGIENNYPTLVRIGLFSGLNGVTITGQLEIYQDVSTLRETFETLNDFQVSGVSGSIQFWLTDNAGSTDLNNSTKKLLLGVVESSYPGIHSFSIQSGARSSDYTHAVVFGVAGNKNVGKAQLVLPLPPG
ncbi:hypothetical protein JNM05_07135 [bacterium]|nr:hypothetical protein [bacterium]